MIGRRRPLQQEGDLLSINTDIRGNGHSSNDGGAKGANATHQNMNLLRTASLTSIATSADHDDGDGTHLSASSVGNTDAHSSSSAHSTARTSSSAMTEEERPSASRLHVTTSTERSHPVVTILELVSNTASSSALNDSFGFNVSRKGNFVAVYTASNIWLIKATQLPRLFARTLEVKRKPVAIDIKEDGSLLAVLSRPSQVDVYEIEGSHDRHISKRRTIMLLHEAHAVTVSPDGLVLITGNRFGIEVVSIAPNAPESCRRTLSGLVGDTVEFSEDGRTLLVTGYARKLGSSSIYNLPYDGELSPDGEPIYTSPDVAWTGALLFPQCAKIARQATLLPDAGTGQVNELFAFNADEDTWGVYDLGTQRFTSRRMFLPDQQRWTRSEFIDDAMPAISPNADLVAVALRIRGTTSIWVYQVPEWDSKPKSSEIHALIQPCFCIPIIHDASRSHHEISVLRWVRIDSHKQRLLAVGNINIKEAESDGPSVPQGSKGILVVLDFDDATVATGSTPLSKKTEYDLDMLLPGEKLPEGAIDFEREVELVRTRTIAQRRAQDEANNTRRSSRAIPSPGRAQTTTSRERPTSMRPALPGSMRDETPEEDLSIEEVQAAFEAPYDNTQPRSQSSLARAATVAALSPASRRHLRALPFRPLEYRRADGLREFPHESDADNWVPPPPAYTATAEASESVSLSHPNAPPAQARVDVSLSSAALDTTLQPARHSTMLSNVPYQRAHGLPSQSSTDLPSSNTTGERRPSLLHPSTYPSQQSVFTVSGRRTSSATQGASANTVPTTNQSAYQATSSNLVARHPTFRPRRAIESTVELHPPPMIEQTVGRRGSAPDAGIRRSINPMAPSNLRRSMLPRLSTTIGDPNRHFDPLSAPPRTDFDSSQRQIPARPPVIREKKSSKKIQCVIM